MKFAKNLGLVTDDQGLDGIAMQWALRKMIVTVAVATTLIAFEARAATDIDPVPLRGEWVRTAEAPVSARDSATIGWTGSEILVVGGVGFGCSPYSIKGCQPPSSDPPLFDGAAYDPLNDSWRKIANAPVSIRSGNTATVGDDVFVLASTSYNMYSSPKRLLRYQPTQDSWDEFSLPEDMVQSNITALGRDALLYYSLSDERQAAHDWQLNTTTGQWTRVPDDPLGPGLGRQFIVFGEDIYLFEHTLVPPPWGTDGPSYLRAARLRQQRWELLPVSDSVGFGPALIAGSRIVFPQLGCSDGSDIEGYAGYGRCIDLGGIFETETGTWHELPNPPGRGPQYVGSSGGISERDLLLTKPGLPAVDLMTNEWFTVPSLYVDRIVQRYVQAAGPYGFAFGGSDGAGQLLIDTWIWKP